MALKFRLVKMLEGGCSRIKSQQMLSPTNIYNTGQIFKNNHFRSLEINQRQINRVTFIIEKLIELQLRTVGV